jgi:hypothetical protein
MFIIYRYLYCTLHSYRLFVSLGGVVVSMLAIEPEVRGIKPVIGRRILKGDKIHSTTFFGGEVKPSLPCKISLNVKDTCGV